MRIGIILGVAGSMLASAPSRAETVPTPSTETSRMAETPSLVFARGKSELEVKTEIAKRLYGLGDGDWSVDLNAGTITFTNTKTIATAPVQVIGTYFTGDGTWLWGWDHPSVPDQSAVAAKAMLAYGKRHGIANITTRKVAISEDDAWAMTGAATYLTGAQGGYRGVSGPTLVFMTFGTVTVKANDGAGAK
jgi:hypothetical protein